MQNFSCRPFFHRLSGSLETFSHGLTRPVILRKTYGDGESEDPSLNADFAPTPVKELVANLSPLWDYCMMRCHLGGKSYSIDCAHPTW